MTAVAGRGMVARWVPGGPGHGLSDLSPEMGRESVLPRCACPDSPRQVGLGLILVAVIAVGCERVPSRAAWAVVEASSDPQGLIIALSTIQRDPSLIVATPQEAARLHVLARNVSPQVRFHAIRLFRAQEGMPAASLLPYLHDEYDDCVIVAARALERVSLKEREILDMLNLALSGKRHGVVPAIIGAILARSRGSRTIVEFLDNADLSRLDVESCRLALESLSESCWDADVAELCRRRASDGAFGSLSPALMARIDK